MNKISRLSLLLVLLLAIPANDLLARGWKGHRSHPAGGPGMMRGGGMMGLCMELDLTDVQINRLVDLHAEHVKQQMPLKRKRFEMHQNLGELLDMDQPDFARIRDLKLEIARLDATLLEQRTKNQRKALDVLTKKQREELGDRPLPFLHGGRGAGCMGPCGQGFGPPAPGQDFQGPGWRGQGRGMGPCGQGYGPGPWWAPDKDKPKE